MKTIEENSEKIAEKAQKQVFLHEKKCVSCEKTFFAKRNNASFCSSKCNKHFIKYLLPKQQEIQQKEQEKIAFEQREKALKIEMLENQKKHEKQKQEKELQILNAKANFSQKINHAQIEAFAEKKANELKNDLQRKTELKHQRKTKRFEILAQHRHAYILRKIDHIAQIEMQNAQAHTLFLESQTALFAQIKKDFEKVWQESPEFHAFMDRINTEKYKPVVNIVKSIADVMLKPQNQPQKQVETAKKHTNFGVFGKK